MLHAYVDPLFGDDVLAFRYNPSEPSSWHPLVSTSGNPRPLAPHPDTTTPTPIVGWLQHAPYSFKTVGAAIQYVLALFASGNAAELILLPHTYPNNNRVTHVVIHCLPGLYGPANTYGQFYGTGIATVSGSVRQQLYRWPSFHDSVDASRGLGPSRHAPAVHAESGV